MFGFGLSYAIKVSLMVAAKQTWQNEAKAQADTLTNSLLASLESNFAPVLALGTLIETVDDLQEFEFKNDFRS